MRRSHLVLFVVLAFVAAACGARVDQAQIEAAGGGFSAGGTPTAGPGESGGGAVDPSGGGAVSGGGGGGGGQSSTDGGGGGAVAPAAPEGGNGGAVDVGITGDTVLLGNVSTLSGPVPGLFAGAVTGAQAVVAYQNSLGGLFGRKFKLEVRDDAFDTGQNRAHTIDLIGKAFAFVGSFSLYDDAAAKQIEESGIPDASYSLSAGRRKTPNNFSPHPAYDGGAPTTGFLYFKEKFPEEVKAVGTIFGDVPASAASHRAYKAAAESVGWNYVYERGHGPTETDFTADVVRMRQSGVKLVYLVATDDKNTARLAGAMERQGLNVPIIANYNPALPQLGGESVEGVWTPSGFALFDGADHDIPEVKLFYDWVQKVKPGAKIDLFAAYSWAAGRMLFQAMEKAGPKAKRADVIRELQKVTEYSAGDLIAPAGPGNKKPPECLMFGQVKGGKWVRVEPAKGWICLGPYRMP